MSGLVVLTSGLSSAGYLLSAVFICIEYFRLGIFYRSLHRVLFISAWIKLAFIIIEVALLIAFGVEEHKGGSNTTFSAALEWGKYDPRPL